MTPVVLFIFNRPDHTLKTLKALSQNTLADKTDLFIFADGPKPSASPEILKKIQETRNIAHSSQWCKTVTIFESENNKGLAQNIISGVTQIINKYGTVIVLEDDIVTGKYFLEYMNNALSRYKDTKEVMHITGWRDPIKHCKSNSSFFYPVMDCWSWATWADRWQFFKKDPEYYINLFSKKQIYKFNINNADKTQFGVFESNLTGHMNTWAVFWYASIFERNGLCLAPTKSLVRNVGFDESGIHCGLNKWQQITDSIDNVITEFPAQLIIDKKEYRKTVRFIRRMNFNLLYSIKCLFPQSLKDKIKKIIHK